MNRKEFFDKQAGFWDEKEREDIADKIGQILKMVEIRRSEKILDVGCGTGVLWSYLRRLVAKNGGIIGLDISSKMLEKAQAKFRTSFEYIQADVHSIPFRGELFDKVICFNAFPHFYDKAKVISEISRVLKTGGTFIITHSAARKQINALHKEIGGVVGDDQIPSTKKMITLFKKVGFVDIQIVDNKDYYYASGVKRLL